MLLLSIRPMFAEAILSGSKSVEFRRRIPRKAEPGTEVAIYASSPTCALVGIATISEFAEATPEELWRRYKNVGGITYAAYTDYFSGSERAVGIVLTRVRRLMNQMALADLRSQWPGFHPPQQFAYLSRDRQCQVLEIPCESLALLCRETSG